MLIWQKSTYIKLMTYLALIAAFSPLAALNLNFKFSGRSAAIGAISAAAVYGIYRGYSWFTKKPAELKQYSKRDMFEQKGDILAGIMDEPGVDPLITNPSGETLVMAAIKRQDLGLLEEMVSKYSHKYNSTIINTACNETGFTPLMYAAIYFSKEHGFEIIKLLVEHGADLSDNIRVKEGEHTLITNITHPGAKDIIFKDMPKDSSSKSEKVAWNYCRNFYDFAFPTRSSETISNLKYSAKRDEVRVFIDKKLTERKNRADTNKEVRRAKWGGSSQAFEYKGLNGIGGMRMRINMRDVFGGIFPGLARSD